MTLDEAYHYQHEYLGTLAKFGAPVWKRAIEFEKWLIVMLALEWREAEEWQGQQLAMEPWEGDIYGEQE